MATQPAPPTTLRRSSSAARLQEALDAKLLNACESGEKEAVTKLLEAGASSRASRNGCRAIHVAIRYGNTDCARVLLDNGANINEANRYGDSALMIACARGDVKSVKALLDCNANPKVYNKEGKTATECTRMCGNFRKKNMIQEMLVQFEAA
eukprot:CAMPEP_0114524084 /NCGR_PEP_ID=MMETSP0109-20121206/21655_1 /TAXON_ID=29199 /ORGANISM="Chlorarachnion reptans, Strain CCCM449" /LENGTH=151 /DNA_ID=CAMNT_0001705481 /DNA_START=53 /DNA_END=508 /DNA_ORIENTATION=+